MSKRERVVTHYSLDDPTFVQHLFSFSDSIVLLLEKMCIRDSADIEDMKKGEAVMEQEAQSMKGYHFYAMLSRMKYINRWGLMRNTREENICEHSLEVAMIAHSLAAVSYTHLDVYKRQEL